jgi:hypothetical protein
MTNLEREMVRAQTLERVMFLIQRYQNQNARRARVGLIASEIKMLVQSEMDRISPGSPELAKQPPS